MLYEFSSHVTEAMPPGKRGSLNNGIHHKRLMSDMTIKRNLHKINHVLSTDALLLS
jgi:hypothetical protein